MKALRKEPERRYASVEEFSRDIELYLTGMPVRARKSTIAYRGSRYFRRGIKESLVAVLLVLAIVAAIASWETRQRLASKCGRSRPLQMLKCKPGALWPSSDSRISPIAGHAWVSTALSEMLAPNWRRVKSCVPSPGKPLRA